VLPSPQLIFPSKTWFFGTYLNFQWQKLLKNQYLPHSESKSYEINPAHQDLSNNTKGTFQFLRNFQLWFNLLFKNFCTTSPNVMEPSPWTPPGQELSKDTKNTIWSILVQRSRNYKTKQNKLPSFIDRYIVFKSSRGGNVRICAIWTHPSWQSLKSTTMSLESSVLSPVLYRIQGRITSPKQWLFANTVGSYVCNCECLCMYVWQGPYDCILIVHGRGARTELIRWYLVSSL
jgi:hypothetical protein